MLLFILVALISAGIPDEFACIAGPQIYGPECKASLATEGNSGAMILYKITEIISSTNVECMGLGVSNTIDCGKNTLDWYPLGIFSDGGQSTLFWGDNMGYPAIKCKGEPIPSGIKWKFYILGNDEDCCGIVKYSRLYQECCNGKIYNKDDVKTCCGGVWTDTVDCCDILDTNHEYKYSVKCPMSNCCQKDITTFETVCCDHTCFNTQCYKSSNLPK